MASESSDISSSKTAEGSNELAVMDTANANSTQQLPSNDSAGSAKTRCEVYEAQATSTQTSSKVSLSDNTILSQADAESGRTSFESQRVGSGKCESPRDNDTMGRNPTSLANRSHLRAASVVVAPKLEGSLGGPSVGFGAGLRNIPAPIATHVETSSQKQGQQTDVREPIPTLQLPTINETLGKLALASPGHLQLATALKKHKNIISPPFPVTESNVLTVNPYMRRADEIGPAHGIPGVGHLGALLTPPGWKIGDLPISDVEAQRLYDEARAHAVKKLDESVKETGNWSYTERSQRNAENTEQWQRQHKIDQYCAAERKLIYQKWQELKALRPPQAQPQRPTQVQETALPQPVHPPTQTSVHAFQRYQQSQLPGSPYCYSPSTPLSTGSINNRLRYLEQELHFPMRSPMSPATLDPNLVPQTLDSVYALYRANRITIMQMHDGNENFLTMWTSKFGVPRPQGLPVTPMPQYMCGAGQQARPFANTQAGYAQGRGSFDRMEVGLRDRTHSVPATQTEEVNPRPLYAESLVPDFSKLRPHEYFRSPAQLGRRSLSERQLADENRFSGRNIQGFLTAPSNQVDPKPTSEAPLLYYQESATHPSAQVHAEQPYAPTSIVQGAMRTGLASKPTQFVHSYAPTSNMRQAAIGTGVKPEPEAFKQPVPNQTTVRHGRKPISDSIIDAKKGFSVSADQARHLIAQGARDTTNILPNTVGAKALAASSVLGPAPSANAVLNHKQAYNGVSKSGSLTSGAAAHRAVTLEQKYANGSQTLSENNANSKLRGDSPLWISGKADNPKDAPLGQESQRKVAGTGTTVPARKTTVASKRRKSETAEPAPTKKRTRMSLDGTADCEA